MLQIASKADIPRLAGRHPRVWVTRACLLERPESKQFEGIARLLADNLFITSKAATGLKQQLGAWHDMR